MLSQCAVCCFLLVFGFVCGNDIVIKNIKSGNEIIITNFKTYSPNHFVTKNVSNDKSSFSIKNNKKISEYSIIPEVYHKATKGFLGYIKIFNLTIEGGEYVGNRTSTLDCNWFPMSSNKNNKYCFDDRGVVTALMSSYFHIDDWYKIKVFQIKGTQFPFAEFEVFIVKEWEINARITVVKTTNCEKNCKEVYDNVINSQVIEIDDSLFIEVNNLIGSKYITDSSYFLMNEEYLSSVSDLDKLDFWNKKESSNVTEVALDRNVCTHCDLNHEKDTITCECPEYGYVMSDIEHNNYYETGVYEKIDDTIMRKSPNDVLTFTLTGKNITIAENKGNFILEFDILNSTGSFGTVDGVSFVYVCKTSLFRQIFNLRCGNKVTIPIVCSPSAVTENGEKIVKFSYNSMFIMEQCCITTLHHEEKHCVDIETQFHKKDIIDFIPTSIPEKYVPGEINHDVDYLGIFQKIFTGVGKMIKDFYLSYLWYMMPVLIVVLIAGSIALFFYVKCRF